LGPRIRILARDLIRNGLASGKVDMVNEVMLPLMAELTMTDVLGLEVSKAAAYSLPIHHMTQRDYPHAEAAKELAWLGEQLTADIRENRINAEAILGELSRIEYQGRPLTDQELQMIAMNLLTGGIGTTAYFMGSVIVFLGRNVGHRRQLLEDSELIPAAIEELLRVFTPTQNFGRSITRDTEVAGCPLRKGEKVMIGYGAANFDPNVFQDPQKIDFARKPGLHMSFGIGPHRCLGSHLAKQAASITTATLLELAPDYRLAEDELGQNTAMASMFGYHRVPILSDSTA
jgi:cytochrome P450